MRKFTRYGLTAGMAAVLVWGLAGCGGKSDGNQTPKVSYTSVVSFGDSLSDPGAYKVGAIDSVGGGLFTVNGITGAVGADPVPSYTWAQLVSAAAVGKVSCAARTGGFGVPTTPVAGCTNYAQGGSRVTDPLGTGNKGFVTISGQAVGIAALTEPVVTQVTNYLATQSNQKFTGTELVTVQGGANELFAQAGILTQAATAEGNRVGASTFGTTLVGLLAAGATNPVTAAQSIGLAMATEAARSGSTSESIVTAAVGAAVAAGYTAAASPTVYGPIVASANSAAIAAGNAAGAQYAKTTGAGIAIAAMAAAATELSNSVKDMINNKGAKHVVVTNLPDVSLTPYAYSTVTVANGVTDNSTQQLVLAMTQAFNNKLKADLTGQANVLFVDVFTENQKQIASPSQFGLSNVKDVACNLSYGINPLATLTDPGSSLACKSSNLIAGDTSRYLFADSVHPTPYGHKLLAQLVTKELVLAGWL